MPFVISVPVLISAVILQIAILSRITLLNGPADLVLLTLISWTLQERKRTFVVWVLLAGLLIGWISAIPFWVPMIAFMLVGVISLLIRNRVWQIPVLALFTATILGTLITHGLSYLVISLGGTNINWQTAFNQITLPSLLLNLLLAIPVYGILGEIVSLTHPVELEV